ncbi:MAG: putative phosphoesterase [Acidimicrobiia bacterium]|nr:putative phosphoesterase [Acidimicrobiia bacterium]
MIRIAAVGDIHAGVDSVGTIRPGFEGIDDRADVLLIAGDLTRYGSSAEAAVLADELRQVRIPTFAVLGNHDYHSDCVPQVVRELERRDIHVLEGESVTLDVDGVRLGIVGSKGFGGGFAGACATAFGEPEMKAFVNHTQHLADRLGACLTALDADLRVALLHYSPTPDTLAGEREEIYPFLGSHQLGEAIDQAGAHLVLHGHAHAGTEHGITAAGVPVRNVAQPVIRSAYRIYSVATDGSLPLHLMASVAPR